MIQFSAINDVVIEDSEKEDSTKATNSDINLSKEKDNSKEKHETKILKLYNDALLYQKENKHQLLISCLEEIISSSIMCENDIMAQLKVIKAASYKLLANTFMKLKQYKKAVTYYEKAIHLNNYDFNMWFGFGIALEQLYEWDLACYAYQEAYKINNDHWPTMEALIVLLFSKVEFESCLVICIRALRMDKYFDVGLYVFRKIFAYQQCMKQFYGYIFDEIPDILTIEISEDIVAEVESKIFKIRSDRLIQLDEKRKNESVKTVQMNLLDNITWETLSVSLIKLFQELTHEKKLESIVNMKYESQTNDKVDLPKDGSFESEADRSFETKESVDNKGDLFENERQLKLNVAHDRVTRNTSQLTGQLEEEHCRTNIYCANLMRQNIIFEINSNSRVNFFKYTKSENQSNNIYQNRSKDNTKYKARDLNNSSQEEVIKFIDSFSDKSPTIIAIIYELLWQLVSRQNMIWSHEMIRAYFKISEIVDNHVSDNEPESDEQVLLSVKRILFDLEIAVDKRQSETERKCLRERLSWKDFICMAKFKEMEEKIMDLQSKSDLKFSNDLCQIQLRLAWLQFIMSEMSQDEESMNRVLLCMKECLLSNDVRFVLRPNCVHHALISLKKVDDNLDLTVTTLRTEFLQALYNEGKHEYIVEKIRKTLGTINLAQDDYVDEIANRFIQVSFLASSIHHLLVQGKWNLLEHLQNAYMTTLAAFHDVASMMDILVDPAGRNYSSITESQSSILTRDYFRVSSIILSAFSMCLKVQQDNGFTLIDLTDVESLCTLVVLTKEYFFHLMYTNRSDMNIAHVSVLFSHLKFLESHDPKTFNQSITNNPNEELDLPPSINLLFVIHEYYGNAHYMCTSSDGVLLKFIVCHLTEYLENIRPRFKKFGGYLANRGDILSVLTQAIYCVRPIVKPTVAGDGKVLVRQPEVHMRSVSRNSDTRNSWSVGIDLNFIDAVLQYIMPDVIPDIDSIKSLSISVELNSFFSEVLSLCAESIFKDALAEETIYEAIDYGKSLDVHGVTGNRYSKLLYLKADHYLKNNEFKKALKLYIKHLRFSPVCFNSWTGVALIFYKMLESKLNMIDDETDILNEKEVTRCLNSFKQAVSLDENNLIVLVEMGSFCYEIHSYASRIIKKSLTREIDENHILVCEKWRLEMLSLAYDCYLKAVGDESESEEKWLHYYMLAKCMEKLPSYSILDVLDTLEKALAALDASGAKYAKKIVLYSKLPCRGVEAVELYYRYHAVVIHSINGCYKELLGLPHNPISRSRWPPHSQRRQYKLIDAGALSLLHERLLQIRKIPFITHVGARGQKNQKNRKRATGATTKPEEDGAKLIKVHSPDSSAESPHTAVTSTQFPQIVTISDQSQKQSEEPIGDDDCYIVEEVILPNSSNTTSIQSIYERCADLCKNAMETVLQRLPNHFKAIYHLSKMYLEIPHLKNIQMSFEYLMGSVSIGNSNINGLFKLRKQYNFFHGVWKIPVAEIDRNGNFSYHIYRSLHLLLSILREMNAWKELLCVNDSLRKTIITEKTKGILNPEDKVVLVRKSMGHALVTCCNWIKDLNGPVSRADLNMVYRMYLMAVKQCQGKESMMSVLKKAFYMCEIAMENYRQLLTTEEVNREVLANQKQPLLNFSLMEKVLINLK